ncbi:ribonuclease 3-like protein 2 [Typha angustifolia]|uniref:ribonuclease 3-like protein 2 n=1 Tax=Typha angustifolia TaxID=59011 RepID=UPI003C2DA604
MKPANGSNRRQDKQQNIPLADSSTSTISSVERLLNYSFRNRTLLQEALTHRSSSSSCSYQRLEFFGDAVLGLAFSKYFFLRDPDLPPGLLTVLRAANISTEKLARVAVRHDLYSLLRRDNTPDLDKLVSEFTEEVMREPKELGGHPYGGSTMKAPKVLADIVEAIAAAVYMDCNFDLDKLWKVIRVILEPIVTMETLDQQPVTMLNELCQKHKKKAVFNKYRKGKLNIVKVVVDEQVLGIGSSEQKKIAKLNAARAALQRLATEESALLTGGKVSVAGPELGEQKVWKDKLNVLCRKMGFPNPVYEIEEEQGPNHAKKFICSVSVETSVGTIIVFGDMKSKVKDAQNAAAFKMFFVQSVQ